MGIRRITGLLILLISALCISGCFDYQERIVLNKDASGTMAVDYWIMNDVRIDSGEYGFPDKGGNIRKEVKKKYTSDKIKLTEFNVSDEKDTRHVHFKVAFVNILDLNDVEQFQNNKIRFTQSGTNISYERSITLNEGNKAGQNEPEGLFGKLVLGFVKDGLSNIRFRFEVVTPYRIDQTNADSKTGGNRAVWKFRLPDVMGQPDYEMRLSTGDGSLKI